jgi:anti-sigma regulatory factor (Ser/Thr protein kinase)
MRELTGVLDGIEAALLEQNLSKDVSGEMRLVAEEAVTNVLSHAYGPGGESTVAITLEVQASEIRLEIRDHGPPFNPLEAAPPRLDLPIEERPVGGLGIHLIKTLTDEQRYARESDENVLILVKRRETFPL